MRFIVWSTVFIVLSVRLIIVFHDYQLLILSGSLPYLLSAYFSVSFPAKLIFTWLESFPHKISFCMIFYFRKIGFHDQLTLNITWKSASCQLIYACTLLIWTSKTPSISLPHPHPPPLVRQQRNFAMLYIYDVTRECDLLTKLAKWKSFSLFTEMQSFVIAEDCTWARNFFTIFVFQLK